MKILHISYSDISGGAAKAAYRLHKSLLTNGHNSQMLVQKKISNDDTVSGPSTYFQKGLSLMRIIMGEMLVKLQQTENKTLHTPGRFNFGYHKTINKMDADVIHLHFVRDVPSISEIGKINKPVVWTLHDMWAFCGAEHYAPDTTGSRWKDNYDFKTRRSADKGLDLDQWNWKHKKRLWKKPIPIICPSRWLAGCVANSSLMRTWPCTVIPNVLDTKLFKPLDRRMCREIFNLPQDKKIILFGAFEFTEDTRKGFDLLHKALINLSSLGTAEFHCVIFGQSPPVVEPDLGFPVTWMGYLFDEWTLALLYNAVDIMIVPSRQENLPQTATEAQACGCPVVAFNTCGLPDVIIHKQTGYLARSFEPEDLANGISWVLKDKERYDKLSAAARDRAVRLWSPHVVVPQYLDVYKQTVQNADTGSH